MLLTTTKATFRNQAVTVNLYEARVVEITVNGECVHIHQFQNKKDAEASYRLIVEGITGNLPQV